MSSVKRRCEHAFTRREKQSRTQRMYDKRVGGGWVTWHEVQQAQTSHERPER